MRAALLLLWMPLASPAVAQDLRPQPRPPAVAAPALLCGDHAIFTSISEAHGATLQFRALHESNSLLIEGWADEKGDWAITVVGIDGSSCVVWTGTGWAQQHSDLPL